MPTLTLLDDAMLRANRMVPAVNRLGGGTIAMAGNTQPWRVVGSDAVVYQLRQPNGRVLALRCLLTDTPDPGLLDRYRALSADQTRRRLGGGGTSPIVSQILFIQDGLSLPGSELRSVHQPIVAMDWVMGATLIAATDRACRARDAAYLSALAQAWLGAIQASTAVGFVHGNLTGDNAMVRPREGIAFVDYDTAYWPGAPWQNRLEPRPGYGHPRGVPMVPELRDDFAALVVYTSLRVLAAWPELREEHGDPASQLGGVLLFSARDLANPDGSALFGKLRVLDDPAIHALVAALREACRSKPDDVVPFLKTVEATERAVRSIPPARAVPSRETLERQQNLSRLNGFLAAGDEEGAYHFWRTSGLIDDPAAIHEMGTRIEEIERERLHRAARTAPEPEPERPLPGATNIATNLNPAPAGPERPRKRSEAVEQLRIALEHGDVATIARVWPDLRHDASASAFAPQANEVLAKVHATAIKGAIERGDDDALTRAVMEAERAGFAIGSRARQEKRLASRRIDGRKRLDSALSVDDRAGLADMALSGLLDEMGDFDQPTTRQIMRALATPHLERAVAMDDDNAIVSAYEEEIFGGLSGVPAEHVERVALAVRRVRWLKSVRQAVKGRDAASLRRAMDVIPAGAEDRLSKAERSRIRRLVRQDEALTKLRDALQGGDDMAIVDALHDVETAGATLPEDLPWGAVRGVIDRLSLIASIRRAASAKPIDHSRLARLLAQAREEMPGETPYLGANLDFTQLEQDVWRAAHRARVRDAIRAGDDKGIVAAALPDLYGAIATLEPDEQDRVQRAVANHRGTGPLGRPASHLGGTAGS